MVGAAASSSARTPELPRGSGAVFWTLVVGFVATLAYWVVWFFVNRAWLASASTPAYFAFENAFPLADAWMACAALAGAIALRRKRASAMFWILVAGSASVYLGCMDVLFDLENGIYLAPTGDWGGVIVEAIINIATLVAGACVMVFAWRNRRRFLALENG